MSEQLEGLIESVKASSQTPYKEHVLKHLAHAALGLHAHERFVGTSNNSGVTKMSRSDVNKRYNRTPKELVFGHRPKGPVVTAHSRPDAALEALDCSD